MPKASTTIVTTKFTGDEYRTLNSELEYLLVSLKAQHRETSSPGEKNALAKRHTEVTKLKDRLS